MALTRKHHTVVRDERDRAILDAMGEKRPLVLKPGEKAPSKGTMEAQPPTATVPIIASEAASFVIVTKQG